MELHLSSPFKPAFTALRRGSPCSSQDELHHAAGQIRKIAARQNEKPGVVGQKSSPLAALLGAPADESVPSFEMPGRGAPTGKRQPLPTISRDITKLLTDQLMAVEIVVDTMTLPAVRKDTRPLIIHLVSPSSSFDSDFYIKTAFSQIGTLMSSLLIEL